LRSKGQGPLPSDNEPHQRSGERRHLTVVFCDIVGSSRLQGRFDPEDWGEIISAYHHSCEAVVHHFGGYVAEKLGDGLIAHFGRPAPENGAERAVRAGLGMIEAMRVLNAGLECDHGVRLQVRIGIDRGLVVVGAMENGREKPATGAAITVAARLQSVAQPDTLVISAATHNLVRPFFTVEDLGPKDLANLASPIHAYRVISWNGVERRFDAVEQTGLTPLVGREGDVEKLLDAWALSAAGESQIAYIEGEPGIGKSRLVNVLQQQIPNSIEFRCSPYDSHSALFPVIREMERWLGFDQLTDGEKNLDRLEEKLLDLGFSLPEMLPLISSQFSLMLPDRYSRPDLTPKQRRQQTLNVLVEWLVRLAERKPLMAVWEDLHWADPSTIELLGQIIERVTRTAAPLLILMTFRPDEFRPPWAGSVPITEILLTRLEPSDAERMIGEITTGRSLPREAIDQIIERTEGVPLFVEEFARAVLEAQLAQEDGAVANAPGSPALAIPESLADSLMSRLDRLGDAKTVAQRGAILGRTFSQDLLRAVLDAEAGDREQRATSWLRTEQCLTQLVDAGVLRSIEHPQVEAEPCEQKVGQGSTAPTTYEFKHALIQGAAYQSLLKRTRQAYHLQTARVLEKDFPYVADTQPELVARHYTEARELDLAFDYWQKAGEYARNRSANKEAIHHVAQGLKILDGLPESESRDRRELALRVASFTPVIAVEGYAAAATARTAERALEICRRLGDVEKLFPVLYTLWANRIVSSRYQEALQLTKEFFREASNQQDSAPRLMSHRLRGISLAMVGQLPVAEGHLRQSMSLYEPEKHGELKTVGYGQDPYSSCESFMALVRWLRGYPDEAAQWSRLAIEHAQQARHTNTLGYVLNFGAATFEAFRKDVARTAQHASTLIAFAEQEGLPVWLAYARVLYGWTLAHTGQVAAGITGMEAGLVDFEDALSTTAPTSLHQGFMKTFLLSLLSEAHSIGGQTADALTILDAAWSFAEMTGEAIWKAELQRLKGEAILEAGRHSSSQASQEAEACFQLARDIARSQDAKALELRAAISLNQLWRSSRPGDGRQVLAEVYNEFTEGFESSDLLLARRLLDDPVTTQRSR
jgi:class 3 adenylate cyclase/predicted ATPase